MPFVLYLAYRFLVDGKAQTLLIVAGVAVGVSVQVFVTALIDGLQKDLIAQTVGVQPHVVVEPLREEPRSVRPSESGTEVVSRVARTSQRVHSIDGWPRVVSAARRLPGVRAVSPKVSGPGLALHGEASSSVVIQGVQAETWDAIVPIARHVVAGRFVLDARDALLGSALAEDLGVNVGDRVRLETAGGRGELFAVRGIFDLGSKEANSRWALVSLRSGQMLFDLPGGATHIDVTVDNVFDADRIAESLRASTGLAADSWMTSNAQLLSALRSQSSSTTMIEAFVLLSVAMGITSVLVVSVVERRGQIGILRALGTRRRSVLGIFLVQGAVMGLIGALVGCVLGAFFCRVFQYAMANSEGVVHTIDFTPSLFLTTTAIAVCTGLLAAALPARHAARLDPAVAIRHV